MVTYCCDDSGELLGSVLADKQKERAEKEATLEEMVLDDPDRFESPEAVIDPDGSKISQEIEEAAIKKLEELSDNTSSEFNSFEASHGQGQGQDSDGDGSLYSSSVSSEEDDAEGEEEVGSANDKSAENEAPEDTAEDEAVNDKGNGDDEAEDVDGYDEAEDSNIDESAYVESFDADDEVEDEGEEEDDSANESDVMEEDQHEDNEKLSWPARMIRFVKNLISPQKIKSEVTQSTTGFGVEAIRPPTGSGVRVCFSNFDGAISMDDSTPNNWSMQVSYNKNGRTIVIRHFDENNVAKEKAGARSLDGRFKASKQALKRQKTSSKSRITSR